MNSKYLLIFVVLVSCRAPEKPLDSFSKYTQKEKDSLAINYNTMSDYLSQPSQKHRLMKDTAIMLDPKNVEYRQVLSYSYKKRGDHLKAMEILNKAVEMDIQNKSKDALEYRAWSLLYYYRDYEGTIADVDKIVAMSGTKYNVCWGEPCGLLKGQALYRLGKYIDAIGEFDLVLAEEKKKGFNPDDNFLVHFYKGMCQKKLEKYDDALQSFQVVLNLDPNYTEALFQTGLIYQKIGKNEKAKIYLEKALGWVKKGRKMGEPYFERFDEVFLYQIEEALLKLQ